MTWIRTSAGFGLDNLPYGAASTVDGGRPRAVVRVGDSAVDMAALARDGLLPPECDAIGLDPLMAAAPGRWAEVRALLVELLSDERHRGAVEPHVLSLDRCRMHLPFTVADFTDFYSSEAHASNVGRMFRPDAPPLLENWKHLPVGYHGRSGTVVVSGTPVRRPAGQRSGPHGPEFGPSERLDFELELGFVVGTPSAQGESVPVDEAEAHLFGVVLLNDWSARDIQAWEYVPLGPFLGKSFATTISPWVVPMAALESSRRNGPVQDPRPLDYLASSKPGAFSIDLEASIRASGSATAVVTRTDFADMYWSVGQQVAHLTVNGASLRTGDLIGSGTVSGWEPGSYGSLLETSWNGSQPFVLSDGSSRTFLEDGDEVILSGRAGSVSFGDARGVVMPA